MPFEGENSMDRCECGANLSRFWIWRDTAHKPHASAFEPNIRADDELFAVSARDAVRAAGEKSPRHDVHSATGRIWIGGCRIKAVAAEISPLA